MKNRNPIKNWKICLYFRAWIRYSILLTWASEPDETSTFSPLEKARLVIPLEWALSSFMICMNKQGEKTNLIVSFLMVSFQIYMRVLYLIPREFVKNNCRILHSNSNYIIILRVESNACCCRFWLRKSPHFLHSIQQNCRLDVKIITSIQHWMTDELWP